MDGEITLIVKKHIKDNIGNFKYEEIKRNILVSVKSITSNEFFAAGRNGLKPQICFVTPKVNYNKENEIEYVGIRYSVYRTYEPPGTDEIEIYVERKVANG